MCKKYLKIISSEAIRGIKLKLCRANNNISLYKNDVLLSLLNGRGHIGFGADPVGVVVSTGVGVGVGVGIGVGVTLSCLHDSS